MPHTDQVIYRIKNTYIKIHFIIGILQDRHRIIPILQKTLWLRLSHLPKVAQQQDGRAETDAGHQAMELCSQDLTAFGDLPWLISLPPSFPVQTAQHGSCHMGMSWCSSLDWGPQWLGPASPIPDLGIRTLLTLPSSSTLTWLVWLCRQGDPRATSRTSDFLPCYHIPKPGLEQLTAVVEVEPNLHGLSLPRPSTIHIIIWPWLGLSLNVSGKNSGSLVVFFSMIFQTDWRKGLFISPHQG